MKLLFDQNLSLEGSYPNSTISSRGRYMSRRSGSIPPKTARFWEFAKTNEFTIVSKDSDFRQLSFLYGQPPKTIWLRIGNAATELAVQTLRTGLDAVDEFAGDDEAALLIIEPATS